jgi:hypothetical protein
MPIKSKAAAARTCVELPAEGYRHLPINTYAEGPGVSRRRQVIPSVVLSTIACPDNAEGCD